MGRGSTLASICTCAGGCDSWTLSPPRPAPSGSGSAAEEVAAVGSLAARGGGGPVLLGPKASKTVRGASLPLTATAPRSRYRTRVADRACGGGDMCET